MTIHCLDTFEQEINFEKNSNELPLYHSICKLQRNAQILSILFDNGFNVKGIVFLKT